MCVRFLLLYIAITISPSPRADASGDATLQRIRAEFRERSLTTQTMRVLFRRMPPPDQSGKYRTDVEPRQYEWLLSGSRERLTESPWKDKSKELQGTSDGALPEIPQWDSFDGLIGYHVDYWPKTPEKISTIHRMQACPETLRNCWIPVYLGIRLPYAAMQLNDLLQTPGTALIGQDKVDDVTCLHIRLPSYDTAANVKHDLELWLDEDHGFALRQLRLSPTRLRDHTEGVVQFEPGEVSLNFTVGSLIAVNDPILQRKRWLPASWSAAPKRPPHTVVDRIELNLNIDPKEFIPVPMEGTEIVDKTDTQAGTRTFIVGGEEGIASRQAQLKNNIVGTPQPPSSGGAQGAIAVKDWNARPPSGSSLPTILCAIAAVCCIASIALTYWFRQVH